MKRCLLYKVIGETILLVPITLLLILGIGELSGGIISGLQHFLQLLPLLILALFSWKYPKIGGSIIFTLSTILTLLYFFFFGNFPLWTKLLNTFLLFGLPLFSGAFFFMS